MNAADLTPLQKEQTNKIKRPSFGQRIAGKTPDPGTPTSRANAAAWNAPGGGYDQWKQGDQQREKDLPVGKILPRKPLPPDQE